MYDTPYTWSFVEWEYLATQEDRWVQVGFIFVVNDLVVYFFGDV